MGNTPSSEDPRRPQKLSKLQLGSDAPGTGPHHALNQLETHHGRSSNSYLVGSGPGSSPNSSPIEPSHPGIGIAISVDDFEHGKPPLPRRNSRRDSRLWSIVSRNHSFKPDHTRSRSMTAPTTRPRSFVSDGDALPLAQGENLRTIRHCSSANLNVRTREAQQLQTLDREGVDESSLSTPENQSPTCDVTENTWKSSHPTYNARSIPRSNSDASIYMPMRRRSLVQTPGVATRAYPSTSTASGRSNFPNSLSTPSQTRHSSIESSAVPSLSIPPVKFGSHTPERVVTPCEAEYKQLGGMKFGSLRIMNGAPKLSPRIEKDNNMDGGFAPTTATSADQESRSSPRLKGSDERNGSFTENGTGIEYAVPEILYVRDDPNAKPTAETIRLELESKTLKNLNRSDSGFISSPSSEGSRKAVSKTDSGYSSNVSLRSLQSLRSAATDASRKSPEKEQNRALSSSGPKNTGLRPAPVASSNDATTRHPQIQRRPGTMPIVARSDDQTPAKISSHKSLSSLTREGPIKMPSLTGNENHKSQLPTSRPRSSPAQTQRHIVHSSSCPPTPVLSQDTRATHWSRTQRIPSTSQRKGPPKVRNNRTASKTIQRSRSDITQRPTENNRVYGNDSRRPMLHDDKSKETLRTIMSMGSTDVLNAQGRQSIKAHDAAKQGTAEPTTPKTPRRGSFRARAKSITQAATTLLISGKSPVTKMSKSTDAGSPRRKAEVADQTVLHNGKEPRVTSQTEREPINKAKPELPKTPDHHSVAARRNSLPALSGSRSSLPETNSAPYRVKKTRTPPPVSMQTRSGKKSRGQGLSHSQSAPSPAELAHLRQPSVPREARRDMIQSYPQAQGAPEFYGNPSYNQVVSLNQQQLAYLHRHRTASWHTGSGSQSPLSVAQPGHQRRSSAPSPQGHHGHSRVRSRSGSALSQQQLGRLSPQVQPMYGGSHMGQQWLHPHPMQFNGQVHGMDAMMYQELDRHVALTPQPVHSRHRRAVSQGATYSQNPPFRVLHSYNSPAYKGAPIWG